MTMSEANRAIGESIERWVDSLPFEGEAGGTGILGDWIAVVCMVDVNAEGAPAAKYYLAMKDGTMLPHIAEGLLNQGISELSASDDE